MGAGVMNGDERRVYETWRDELERLNDLAACAAASGDPTRCREIAEQLETFEDRSGPRSTRVLELKSRAAEMRRELLKIARSSSMPHVKVRSDSLTSAVDAMVAAALASRERSAILALKAIVTTAQRALAAIEASQAPEDQPGPHGADESTLPEGVSWGWD